MSNITLNIVEPSSPTPDPVVPNTGLFTSGIGGAETAIIVTITLVVVLAIIGAFIYYKKKQGKTPSLFARFKHTKSTTGLAALALLVSIATVAGLVKLTTSAIEGEDSQSTDDSSALTVDVSSTELTIELADDPVFAVLPVDITVEEATTLGYTLTAYTDSTNLVSTTDSSNIIPMVTVDTTDIEEANEAEELRSSESDAAESSDSSSLAPLSPNTYGLSFTDPESALDEVYTSLSTGSTTPTFITDKDYLATEANDTTTIYYGFYITPDTPYGTYTGSNITVDAIPNIATVTYNANGLYFNDSEEATENTVGYKPNIAEAPIEEVTGEYLTPAPLTPVDPSTPIHYTFLGWSEEEGATTPTYTNEEDILANLTLIKNESLTLYAVWHYDTVLSFNGTTSDGGEAIEQQTIAAGTTITLPQNTYTRTGSVFTNWNTVAEPTEQDPGESYEDEADFTAPDSSADITLYAQWAYYTTITFDGNGETSGTMNPQTIVAGTPQNLTKNTFVRTNATFIGWNTVQYPTPENPGTAYEDQAEFIADATQHEDITLYAQWAYTTISFSGNTSDSGTMNSITIAGGTTSNLPAKAFTKNNCIFTGWNTEANGTGISYGDSTPYTANATTIEVFTLYAQWQCISQVNYYGNGATSGEMASSIILGGSTLTFPQNSYAKDGYVFNGWNTVQNPTAENPGTSYPDQGTFAAPMTPATTLNLYAQWLPTTTITFNGNGETSGTMSDQVIVAGTPQNLTPNAYAKDGYIFTGWNTVQTPTTENPGTAYADKAEYTASTTQPESITLYAQWKIPPVIGDLTYMQDFASLSAEDKVSVLNSMSQETSYTLKDKRDEQDYTVAKLKDNNIWMTQNLDLDIEAGRTYTSADTDLANSTIGTSWTPTVSTGTTSSWASFNTTPSSYNPGDLYWNGNVTLSGGNLSDRTTTEPSATYGTHYHVGNYYNWTAAVAMNDSSSYTTYLTDVNQSICPAGWRLPTYSGDKSYLNLKNTQGFTSGISGNIQSAPTYFVYGGDRGGSSNRVGSYGYYWSSVVVNSNSAHLLSFSAGGNLYPQNSFGRNSGFSIRCVAR